MHVFLIFVGSDIESTICKHGVKEYYVFFFWQKLTEIDSWSVDKFLKLSKWCPHWKEDIYTVKVPWEGSF